jgi:hypothetical protein
MSAPVDDSQRPAEHEPVVNDPPFHQYRFPIYGSIAGEPLPDLTRIPERDWSAALAPISGPSRRMATTRLDQAAFARAAMIELELPPARWTPSVPESSLPRALAQVGRGGDRARQVNVRLRKHEHAVLVEAAAVLAMTPTQLARTLMVDGARRTLAERDAG